MIALRNVPCGGNSAIMDPMLVACCQLDIAWEDKARNHERVSALLDRDPLPRGALLLLPEMFSTGFSMHVARVSEGPERQSERFLADLARARGLTVHAGLVTTAADGRGQNEAVTFDPSGRELARYRKLHPFSFGGESTHYAAGDRISTYDWQGLTVAPFICYDLRFPEAFRAATRRGAQLLTVIANWPRERELHWLTLLRARAIENQAFVAGVNRCGADPRLTYGGRSLIIDPRGEILAEAGPDEGLLRAELDLASLTAWRRTFPALADMRDDLAPSLP
jgi:omega-amidase